METNPFKGTISFAEKESNSPKKRLLSFDVTNEATTGFTDTFLCEFDAIKFSHHEKRDLTYKDREIIKQYEHVEAKTISYFADKLIEAIKTNKNKRIFIKASDFGVYICLAAIFSGKLPYDKKICFHLSNTPLAVFPVKLIRKKPAHNLECRFNISEDSWIKPFKSLYQKTIDKNLETVLKAA